MAGKYGMDKNILATSTIPHIEAVTPALVDEKITILVKHLEHEKPFTLAAVLEEDKKIFLSFAHYSSDCNGEIDLSRSRSSGGLYTGVEPMGLFWSMIQAAGQKPGLRIMKKDATRPFQVELCVIPGHITVTDRDSAITVAMATTILERSYIAPGVRRFLVKEYDGKTRIRGSFFLPSGKGPFPGVIDLFGSAGGLNDYRAALFASRGFASLSLAYFDYDDLTENLDLEMEYFSEAVDWLYSQPEVMKTGIGVIGVSKGGELVTEMSVLNSKVKAVVPINGASCLAAGIHKDRNGQIRMAYDGDFSLMEMTDEGAIVKKCTYDRTNIPEDAYIKIENAENAHYLFIAGDDDQQIDPRHVDISVERLQKAGKSNYKSLLYHGAGHLIEPPYTPLGRTAFHKMFGGLMFFGGEAAQHAFAQEHSWQEILEFFRKHLTETDTIRQVSVTEPKIRVTTDTNSATHLVDDKLGIKITGLEARQRITAAAYLEEEGITFISHGHYTADEGGRIDISKDWCASGTYTGVEAMGLFWSMQLAPGQKPGLRLMKKNVLTPFRVELSVLPGHVDVRDTETAKTNAIVDTVIERFYMAKDVKRINIKESDSSTRIRGTLFLPPGPGPFPGVVDMFGTAGGLNEYRAALLASRGFACMALAFFGYDDLPPNLSFDLEYFSEAVDWLHDHPKVKKTGVGALGVSKGAELAIHMAVLNHKVRAAVPINPYYYSHSAIHYLKGVKQSLSDPDFKYWEVSDDGYNIFRDCYWRNAVQEDSILEIEKAVQTTFLFIGCDDDQMAAPGHVRKLEERLRNHGLSNYRSIIYPKAGHLLEPPYTPAANIAYHKIVQDIITFGGETKPHADAQEHSWKEIQRFLWQTLDSTPLSKL